MSSKLISRVRSLLEREERIGVDDCCELFQVKDLAAVAALARIPRERRHGRNAHYRALLPIRVATLDELQLLRAGDQRLQGGVTGVAVRPVGPLAAGLDPLLSLQSALRLLPVPATLFLSAGIVAHAADGAGVSIQETLQALMNGGDLFINGDGAELSDPTFRAAHSAGAIPFQQWIAVHRAAHIAGLKTGASMLYTVKDRPAEYAAHLQAIRELQDETHGFVQFVPMGIQNNNVAEWYLAAPTAAQSLRVAAIARMFLDTIPHLAVAPSLITSEEAFVALSYGANMIDPTIAVDDLLSDEAFGDAAAAAQPSLPVFAASTAQQRGGILPALIHSRIVESRWIPIPMDAAFREISPATILAEQQ
ncbi:MAG: hypothetical protein IT211_07080 [Armatimonadetes bacterium]|nr:hypothetical protein [Armatimonadota bacterium]